MLLLNTVLYLFLIYLKINAEVYLESPPFSGEKSAFGMSRARSPTYNYEYDPEIIPGYVRQDSIQNGTAVNANGKYFLTSKDTFYIRIDARGCQRYPEYGPKICFCYLSVKKDVVDHMCDNRKGFVHICQNTRVIKNHNSKNVYNGSFYSSRDKADTLGNYASYHVRFIFEDTIQKTGVHIYGTNNLAGGLHLANGDYYKEYTHLVNKEIYELKKITMATYDVKVNNYFVVGRPGVKTRGVELYFPNDVPCARIDFSGIMYAGDLLKNTEADARMPIYKVPYSPTAATDNNMQPEGTRTPMRGEIPRPNPVGKDMCEFACCPMPKKKS